MKVNLQCVVKYLKHDYVDIFKPIGIVIGMAVVVIIGLLAIVKGYDVLASFVSTIILHIPSFEINAFTLLNMVAAVVVLTFTVGIGLFGTKEWFEYKPWKVGFGWGPNDTETKGCNIFFIPAFGIGFLVYVFYWIIYALSNPKWEDPLLSTIIFIVLILVGMPAGCAVARCKE
jgi:hypothetical protein